MDKNQETKQSPIKAFFFLTGIMYLIYFVTAIYNKADWDLWARLAVGSVFAQTGRVLNHDIFAYTPTKALWVDHEWGTGVIFYYLSHFLGDFGLTFLKYLIVLFIFILVYKTNQLRLKTYEIDNERHKDPFRIGYYLLLFVGILPAFDNIIRSHCFTYLFFALWLYLLDLVKNGQNRLIWIFPATMLIWANVHGGFLAGLGIVLLYGIGEFLSKRSWKKYLLILGLSTGVTFINPYGIKYWTFLIDAVTMSRPYVNEWNPLNVFDSIGHVTGFKILLILAIVSLIYLVFKHIKKINLSEMLILAATLYMSLKHQRHIIFFVLASASYLYYVVYPALHWCTFGITEKFYALFHKNVRLVGKLTREVVVYGLILIIGFGVNLLMPLKINVDSAQFPTKAVKFIQLNKISGNLLVLFNWGSYALWKLYPQCLVAVDGRYEEVYSTAFIDDVARFHYVGKNWDGLLAKYHADAMLIPLEYKELYYNVRSLNDWKMVYLDNMAAIFVRKTDKKKDWILPDKKFDANKEKFKTKLNSAF